MLFVALAVVAIVLLVWVAVVPVFLRSNPGNGGGPLTFSQARAVADQLDATFQGGHRTLVFAAGVGFNVTTIVPSVALVLQGANGLPPIYRGCSGIALVQGQVAVPAGYGRLGSGALPAWAMVYKNASGGIIVNVVDGVGTVVSTLSGPSCGTSLGRLSLPKTVVDSSDAMTALGPYAGPFLARFSNVDVHYLLLPKGSLLTPVASAWSVALEDCTSNRTAFDGWVNSTTGRASSAETLVGLECRSSLNTTTDYLPNALALGPSYVSASTATYVDYRINVTSATQSIVWSDLGLLLAEDNPLGVANVTVGALTIPLTSGWSAQALGPANRTIAAFDPATWSWSGGIQQPIAAGDQLLIQLTGALVANETASSPYHLGLVGGQNAFWGTDTFFFVL